MSQLTSSIDVSYLARLARITLNKEEEMLFQSQLERVLEHIDKINQLDLRSIEPTAHAISVFDIVREDTTTFGLEREVVLKEAPAHKNGFFIVPKVVES